MKEKWICYDKVNIPMGLYEVVEIIQNSNGTKIELQSEDYKVIICFDFADSLRISDEGRRIKTYNEVIEIQEYRKDFVGIPLYKVINSEFCRWLREESAGFYTEFSHYVIITINDIVDIISRDEPEIMVHKI